MSNLVLQTQHPVTAEQWALVVRHVNQRGLHAVSCDPTAAQEIAEEITAYLGGMTETERAQFVIDQNDYQLFHRPQVFSFGNHGSTQPSVSLRCNVQNEPRYLVFEPGFRRNGNHLVIDLKAGTYHLRSSQCDSSKAS